MISFQELLVKNKYKVLIGVAAVGLTLMLSGKYLFTKQKVKGEFIKPIVNTQVIERKPMFKTISLFGKTTALAKIDIKNKYAGKIEKITVQLGDEVNAGDILIQQDLKEVDLEIAVAKAKYDEYNGKAIAYESEYNADYYKYKAAYELSKMNFERYSMLYETGAVSKLELDTVKQTMIAAQAAYEELAKQKYFGDQPAAIYARVQDGVQKYNDYLLWVQHREDMILKAPRKGIISYRNAEEGAYIPAGTKLLTLTDNSGLYVDCVVSEQDAALLKTRQSVDIDIESVGGEYTGSIIFVSPTSSEESNGYAVRIALDNPDKNLKAGMFAKSEFKYLQKENSICLNKTSIVEKNGQKYLFVLKPDQTVEQRKIKTGIRNDREIEILQGVAEGEIIVTDNLSRLRNGMKVDVKGQEDEK